MNWYNDPNAFASRAVAREVDPVNGRAYRAGEFLPFYVPRPQMPQVNAADYPRLLRFLRQRGVKVTRATVDPHSLRFHQRALDFDPAKMPADALRKPLLVSRDGFVLDGNHRLVWTRGGPDGTGRSWQTTPTCRRGRMAR